MAEKLDYTNPCPGCGDAAMPEKYRVLGCKMNYACESMVSTEGLFIAGRPCLLRQLAAANERAGRLEEERGQLREAWSIINSEAIDEYAETLTHIVAARAMLNAALVEVPDAM